LFIGDILKAKRLRKEIARLQMYRRIGIRTLAEAEKYENDKKRREIHKMSFLQKEADGERAAAAKASGIKEDPTAPGLDDEDIRSSLWKQYRTSDRKNRRSINRSAVPAGGALDQVRVELDGTTKPPGDPASQPLATGAPDAASAVKPAATETPAAPDSLMKDTPMEDGSKEQTATTEPEKATEKNAEKEEAKAPMEEKKGDEPTQEKPVKQPEAEKASEPPSTDDKKDDAMEVDKPAVAAEVKKESKEENKDEKKDESKEEKKDEEAEKKPEEQKPAEVPETNGDSESFPITGMKGFDLLNKKEVELCRKLLMKPGLYLKAKKAIIQESFRVGILDRENCLSRTIVTIDVQKRGNVIDFMVKAGWISTKVGEVMKQ
jgi:hypothetical protein